MKNLWLWMVVAIVLVGGYFVFFNKPSAAGKKEVVLGVIAGTTGQYAPAGEGYLKGFNLAMEQWNKNNARQFKAIIEDDGFDAKKGLTAYQKLKSVNNVDAYGVLSSFTIDAIYDLAHEEGKPVALGFEQSRPAEDDAIFQVLPAAKPVQLALGQELKKRGYAKPAVAVSNNTAVYQNFYDGFKEGFGVGVTRFDIGSDIGDIRSQALAIKSLKPDVVVFFMAPKDGALLARELLRIAAGQKPYFAFDQSIESGMRDYKEIFGADMDALDGSLVSMSKNERSDAFIFDFQAKYNEVPPFGSDMGYNSFMLLATTYDDTARQWVENMKKAKFAGADGDVYFDGAGLRMPTVFFGTLKGGEVLK